MKLKKINNNEKIKNYKININLNSYFKNRFCVGDTIQNKEDNLIGVIEKIKNGTIFVKYKDNTVERFNELNAKEYIDFADIEMPNLTQPQDIKRNLKDIPFTQDIPVDKIAEREYKTITKQAEQNNKEKEVESIVKLAVSKQMIDKDEYEIEKLKALSMDKQDFEDYKDEVYNFNSQSIVSSDNDDEDENLTEAEKMLKKVKSGKIQTAGNVDFDSIQSDTRDITTINKTATINDKKNIPPVISPIINNQEYNKYSWMNEIEWTMGSRN